MILSPTPIEHDGSHLDKAQVDHIESYMRKILQKLDLNYWRVYVAKDLAPERCRLSIEPTDGRRVAMLFVAADWWDNSPPEEKRSDITHEALHLAHHDLDECIRRFVDGNGDVGEYPMSIFWGQAKTELERMVDSLSYVLAPQMPAWSDPKKRRS
jgi:hypothetical protein